MITVTDIRRYRRSRFFEVCSDEQVEFIAKESFLDKHGIRLGATFDEEEFEPIRAQAQMLFAIRRALDCLEQKDYSQKELRRKLCEKGIDADAAELAVRYVAEKGYQDDRRYAVRLTELAAQNYGKKRIEQLLYSHGIEKELIREVLDEVLCDDSAEEQKTDATLLRALRGQDSTDPAVRNKIYAKLARLGYDSAAIRAAFSRYDSNRKDETP